MLDHDEQGCFGGGVEEDDQQFDIPEEAYFAGFDATDKQDLYDFDVVDEHHNKIELDRDALWYKWLERRK